MLVESAFFRFSWFTVKAGIASREGTAKTNDVIKIGHIKLHSPDSDYKKYVRNRPDKKKIMFEIKT